MAAAILGDEHAFRAQTPTVDYGDPAQMIPAVLRLVGAGQPPLDRLRTLASALSAMACEGEEMTAAHCEVAQKLAARLGISKETASHHVRHIYDKLDVSTLAAATLFAMQHNLV